MNNGSLLKKISDFSICSTKLISDYHSGLITVFVLF